MIVEEILAIRDSLPKKQRQLCNFIVMNCDKIGVMTVAELAEAAGVGTSSVVRLVQALNRNSYSAFKKELHDFALTRSATAYRGLKQSISTTEEVEAQTSLQTVMSDATGVLENLCSPKNTEQFEMAIKLLLGARQIFTLGMRSSRSFAIYCEQTLRVFLPQVLQLSHYTECAYDRILLSTEATDVVLVFSVWPCTKETVDIAEFCHDRGMPVILITNTQFNPIAQFANAVIDTDSVNHSSGGTAIMAVIEALAMELGRRTAPNSLKHIEMVEAVLGKKEIVLQHY